MDYEISKNVILKSFSEKKNSHAFLLQTNNIDRCLNEVLDIIKTISCSSGGNDNCNICNTIDSNTNPDLIIIKPDGKEIKKDQILYAVNKFSRTPIVNPYSVYLIVEADKMNLSSANKLLKFLEEPDGSIIGFYITSNSNDVIPTIKSRCQLYNFKFGFDSILDLLNITEDDYSKYFNYSEHLIELLNNSSKFELMLETKNISSKDRIDIQKIFGIIAKLYELKYKSLYHYDETFIDSVQSTINLIAENDIDVLIDRIKLLSNFIDGFKINVNKDLFINKFFLEWK